MRVTLPQNDLLSMLNAVVDALPSRPSVPSSMAVLMAVEEGRCVLSGSGPEMAVRSEKRMTTQKTGRIAIPGRRIHEIVKELPSGPVAMFDRGGRVVLQAAGGEYHFPVDDPQTVPDVPDAMLGERSVIPTETLSRMISKVAFAASQDESRPSLNSVLLHVASDGVTMTATDRHRLARMVCAADVATDGETNLVLPLHALGTIARLLRDDAPLREITVREGKALFSFASSSLFVSLLEIPYADVESVMPADNNIEMTAPLHTLVPALRRIMVLAHKGSHPIHVELSPGSMQLSTANRELGASAEETLDVTYEGERLVVDYNGQYLLDILNRIDTDNVRVRWREPMSAAVVEPASPVTSEQFICLLMPLRGVA